MSLIVVMVGDSDIERWPDSFRFPTSFISGHSGSTLREVVTHVERILQDLSSSTNSECCIIVVCAGENDIGSGLTINESDKAFRGLLDIVFPSIQSSVETGGNNQTDNYLIFLGPKFEPCLIDDLETQRKYVQMSKSFERLCTEHRKIQNIIFIDCLTMFCSPNSLKQAGALLGGKARPELHYFDSDGLHLSIEGYKIWRSIIEKEIQNIALKFGQSTE